MKLIRKLLLAKNLRCGDAENEYDLIQHMLFCEITNQKLCSNFEINTFL